MVQYRRSQTPGGTCFFTVNLRDRSSPHLITHIDDLRKAFHSVQQRYPFKTVAIVILPNHLPMVMELPSGDSDYPGRWKVIKSQFTRSLAKKGLSLTKNIKGEYNLWQRRYRNMWYAMIWICKGTLITFISDRELVLSAQAVWKLEKLVRAKIYFPLPVLKCAKFVSYKPHYSEFWSNCSAHSPLYFLVNSFLTTWARMRHSALTGTLWTIDQHSTVWRSPLPPGCRTGTPRGCALPTINGCLTGKEQALIDREHLYSAVSNFSGNYWSFTHSTQFSC